LLKLYRVRFAHEELVTRLNASERAVALEKAAHWGGKSGTPGV
jgi:hypothetical protein